MTENIIVAEGLVKEFNGFRAVDGIDLTVRKGEFFGLLGPNGAGKTTTIRMVSTLTPPNSGTVTIDGNRIPRDQKKARVLIGISQQHNSLDKDITAGENIIHHAILHKVPKEETERKMAELVELFGLEPYLDRMIMDLSGGWKKKVSIACSLIHSPKILFLDEPTTGLDTRSRVLLWDIMKKLNRDGTTIILTTHYIEEAEELCDRVVIVDHGHVIGEGSPQQLCDDLGHVTVEENNDGLKRCTYFPTRDDAKRFMGGANTESSFIRKTRLEDVYLKLTEKSDGA